MFDSIDWIAAGSAMKTFKPISRPGLIKMIHSWQYNCFRKKKHQDGESENCVQCGKPEMPGHGFVCQARKMCKVRRLDWKVFKNHIANKKCEIVLEKMWLGFRSVEEEYVPEYGKK